MALFAAPASALALEVQPIYTTGPNPTPAGVAYDPIVHSRALTAAEQVAFQRGADAWGHHVRDPITVTVEVYFAAASNISAFADAVTSQLAVARPLANSGAVNAILTNPASQPLAYQFFVHRLKKKNAAKADGVDLVTHLPNQNQLELDLPAAMPAGFEPFGIAAPSALWSALGLDLKPIVGFTLDGRIRFNPFVAWDLDPDDGVGSGPVPWDLPGFRLDDPSSWPPGFPPVLPFYFATDFVNASTHEMGHVLGFISAHDDANSGALATYASFNQNLTPMDLFALREDQLASLDKKADFRFAQRKLRAEGGGTQASLEIGNRVFVYDLVKNVGPSYALLSGGRDGDGMQAAHLRGWRRYVRNGGFIVGAELPFGTDYRPRMAPGGLPNVSNGISPSDLAVLDAIGFDVDYAGLAQPGVGQIPGSATAATTEALENWGLAVAGHEQHTDEEPAESFAPLE
ncbi:MAG: hypothetical protein RIT81_47250 [Deltaproteobacteria bacterium]